MRRYASELLNALARVRPSNELVVFGSPEAAALPSAAERRPVRQIAPTNLGWCLVDLPRAVRRERLDVFHSPAYTAPLRGVHPLVLTIHDVSYERHPEWYPYRRDPLRRWFYRRSAHAADLIITDSEFSRSEISAAYGVDAQRIRVVPLGVGTPFAGATPRQLPPGITAPYVLHVGDLHPRRNLLMLVRALGRLPALSPSRVGPMLVLAGVDRGERAKLEEEARGANVQVHFADATDDRTLADLYCSAAVFAYPSRYEGFGLPLLEAMACGAPVLAARASAIPEVVGDAGILVSPDDEMEMAAGIVRLIEDADLANRLREAGRRRAMDYTWDRTAALTLDAYRAIASR
ncbi:MAG: glycosyltransferase family 4 protein [Vicinamibacterales bacterium]|nr:glycosyltransferase family 4 protein [Vicinamibacterales bacterium]